MAAMGFITLTMGGYDLYLRAKDVQAIQPVDQQAHKCRVFMSCGESFPVKETAEDVCQMIDQGQPLDG